MYMSEKEVEELQTTLPEEHHKLHLSKTMIRMGMFYYPVLTGVSNAMMNVFTKFIGEYFQLEGIEHSIFSPFVLFFSFMTLVSLGINAYAVILGLKYLE
mmetsp:Transcript_47654/g.34913  ORF Transcript_47654/g.34913 Transcript_47654/m.34913 type:complete len:99 (+) Transcript_47654:703-999(+)|eukprot:CAMPEP_0202978404 /NCGR_PEP_ID=MMETSP1396-20130829/84837_1 /ASSEMBLY_ACC=CAM_ASM_000872 /TAXON_ID= /ORGANISM="Pseudokeronopsis sp., Strain Brazil" /LENGTH=98 /DNA_ID=CAMNT_0049717361 /DNA_START=866 /DNA_END=1162 /DNA_ORIENTATION=-